MDRSSRVRSVSFAIVVATLLFVPVHAQQPSGQASRAGGPEVTALAVGTTADPQVGGPWVIAREKGFFAQEGLTQAEVKIFPSGPATFPAFVSGDLKGNSHAEQPMLTQAAGGVRLKVAVVIIRHERQHDERRIGLHREGFQNSLSLFPLGIANQQVR